MTRVFWVVIAPIIGVVVCVAAIVLRRRSFDRAGIDRRYDEFIERVHRSSLPEHARTDLLEHLARERLG
jgi:hypothetical protein